MEKICYCILSRKDGNRRDSLFQIRRDKIWNVFYLMIFVLWLSIMFHIQSVGYNLLSSINMTASKAFANPLFVISTLFFFNMVSEKIVKYIGNRCKKEQLFMICRCAGIREFAP